jgi:hypothetical protein
MSKQKKVSSNPCVDSIIPVLQIKDNVFFRKTQQPHHNHTK